MMSEGHHIVNGITVLGTGPSKPVIFERPTSGRRSTTPTLLQRSGSSLEILPTESEKSSGSKVNEHQSNVAKSEAKDSARSSSSRSSKKDGGDTTATKWKASDSTSSSVGYKKVVLPSVKRNFEKQGMPNNEEYESFVRSTTPTLKESHSAQESSSTISSLETGIHGVQLQSKSSVKTDSVKQVTSDDYYVSHSRSESCNELQSNLQKDGTGSAKSVKKASETSMQNPSKVDDESSDESDDDDEDERKAPIELLGEFLEAVMEEDFENAQKLCQMILIYEPNNKEANEFKPLIDEELRKERERQLWGSSSEEESSEEEDSDEETDASDDDEESDDGSNEESN